MARYLSHYFITDCTGTHGNTFWGSDFLCPSNAGAIESLVMVDPVKSVCTSGVYQDSSPPSPHITLLAFIFSFYSLLCTFDPFAMLPSVQFLSP